MKVSYRRSGRKLWSAAGGWTVGSALQFVMDSAVSVGRGGGRVQMGERVSLLYDEFTR